MLMASGGSWTIELHRCRDVADDLRRGGSTVALVIDRYACRVWDGPADRHGIPHGVARCRSEVDPDGAVHDLRAGPRLTGCLSRAVIQARGSDPHGLDSDGDDTVHDRKLAFVAEALNTAWRPSPPETDAAALARPAGATHRRHPMDGRQ